MINILLTGVIMANVNIFISNVVNNWHINNAASNKYKECLDASNSNEIWAKGEVGDTAIYRWLFNTHLFIAITVRILQIINILKIQSIFIVFA